MTEHNRLAAPLPQSVLDRYHAEHPEESLPKAASAQPPAPTKADEDDFEKVAKIFE
jgi:hypothetical protein